MKQSLEKLQKKSFSNANQFLHPKHKIFIYIIFMGKDNENTKENRNLQRLMEFLEINGKDFQSREKSKSGYEQNYQNQITHSLLYHNCKY